MLFALLAVGLFALTAVAIDLGLARVTADQMRVASQSAALEGLRWRDTGDAERRLRAVQFLEYAFDDDLDPGNGDAIGYGIGPDLQVLTDSDLGANGLLVVGDDRVLDPQVQPNSANLRHGDLVAGSFTPGRRHQEFADYSRTDFAAAAADEVSQSDAFLVRLRRTADVQGLDRVAGVSSSGPPLPWTFGLGAALDPGSRKAGIAVRGTGIATAAPALTVSASVGEAGIDAPSMPGVATLTGVPSAWPPMSFRVDAAPGSGLAGAAFEVFDLEYDGASGEFRPPGPGGSDGAAWGACVESPLNPSGLAEVGDVVGPPFPAPPSAFPPAGVAEELTLALHLGDGTARRRVGFRVARIEVVRSDPIVLRITPLASRIAPRGASAVRAGPQAILRSDPVLAAAHQAIREPLLAPIQGR